MGREADTFERSLEALKAPIEQALEHSLTRVTRDAPARLSQAMRYSLLSGGKRLRPALVLLFCRAFNGRDEAAMPAACALEMIHTYSLIHDDLPAMDDDDLRRGKPTCHKAFDEATAILAGDALLTAAFQVIAEDVQDGAMAAQLTALIASCAGATGMVGGQQMDLDAEDQAGALGLSHLAAIHRKKTGALMAAACAAGAICAGANEAATQSCHDVGLALGLAFQACDDILDVVANAEQLGKTAGKDKAQGKLTYPGLLGLEAAKREAQRLADDARRMLSALPADQTLLLPIADFVIARMR